MTGITRAQQPLQKLPLLAQSLRGASGRERARKRLASASLEKAAARGRAAVRGASAAVVVATARLTCEKERLDRELGRVKHFLGVWQAQPSRKPRARDDVPGVLTCPRGKSTIQVS